MIPILFWMAFGCAGNLWLLFVMKDPDVGAADPETRDTFDLGMQYPRFAFLIFATGLVFGPVWLWLVFEHWKLGQRFRKKRESCLACGCLKCQGRLRSFERETR